MSSEIIICNKALSHIGAKAITDLNDDVPSAVKCNLLYGPARDFVLGDHAWNFAEKRILLALVSDVTPIGYSFAYEYPSDCIALRRIYQPVKGGKPIRYSETSNSSLDGRLILTDLEEAIAIYTAKITVVNAFSVGFEEALAWKLASDLAYPITKSLQKQSAALTVYNAYISTAQTNNAEEAEDEPEVDDDFILARS